MAEFEKEFEQIYMRYFQDVFLFLRRLSGDEHIAEELTSETFFKAMRSIDAFRGECDIRVWLCQIAKNCYYSLQKKQQHTVSVDEWESLDVAQHTDSMEEQAVSQSEAMLIHKLLHELPEPYKEVFMLRVFGELSFGQIGDLFQKTENWACVTYHRARKKIIRRMEEQDEK